MPGLYENQYFDNDQGDLFIQRRGPGTDVEWVPCADLGDLAWPQGDVNREVCPDPHKRGAWKTAVRTQGAQGEATTDITVRMGPVQQALDRTRGCKHGYYIVHRECQDNRATFLPFSVADILPATFIIDKGMTNAVMSNSDQSAPTSTQKTYSLSAAEWIVAYSLAEERKTTSEDQVGRDVAFMTSGHCAGGCGGSDEPCEYAMIGCESAAGPATANVLWSSDGGLTWAAGAADPFAADEHVSSVLYFERSLRARRGIAARGVTDGAAAAEIGYTDDDGATWTNVDIGSTNGEFIPWNGGLFMRGTDFMWACTDTGAGAAGNIYMSRDMGVTWTAMYTGASDALNCIRFANERVGLCVGDTNEVLLTTDGGYTWTSVTGPAAQAAADALTCEIWNKYTFMIGYDDGELWETRDGGASWTERTLTLPDGWTAIDSINDMLAIDDVIFLALEGTQATDWAGIARSIAGGEEATWETWEAPVTTSAGGMQAIDACDINRVLGVGGVATTTMILEVRHRY